LHASAEAPSQAIMRLEKGEHQMSPFQRCSYRTLVAGVALASTAGLAACSSSPAGSAKTTSASTNLAPYTAIVKPAEDAITSTTFAGPSASIKAPRNIKLAIIAESTSL